MLVIIFTIITSGCCICKRQTQECENALFQVEQKIDQLVINKTIREDQGVARKNNIRIAWSMYENGEMTCADFWKKASYHLSP